MPIEIPLHSMELKRGNNGVKCPHCGTASKSWDYAESPIFNVCRACIGAVIVNRTGLRRLTCADWSEIRKHPLFREAVRQIEQYALEAGLWG